MWYSSIVRILRNKILVKYFISQYSISNIEGIYQNDKRNKSASNERKCTLPIF